MKQKFLNDHFLLLVALLISLISCKKEKVGSTNNPDAPSDSVGLVSPSEFNSVPPPTYEEIIISFEAVTKANPELLQDTLALGKAIFNRVKMHPNGDTPVGINELSQLSIQEWIVVILNPINGYRASKTVKTSIAAAKQTYPCDEDVKFTDGKADAIRHAYWNALMVRHSSYTFASLFATAHETEPNTTSARQMDLHNNKIGRDLANQFPEASDDELLQLLLGYRFFYLDKPEEAIPSEAASTLVYFVAKRTYDVTLAGSFSNPDSGGPWNAIFYFNQCDKTIRGEMEITRGTSFQKRRFSGVLDIATNTINLTVANPYQFENPPGYYPCLGMAITLNGNELALHGSWSSYNCSRGGIIDLVH